MSLQARVATGHFVTSLNDGLSVKRMESLGSSCAFSIPLPPIVRSNGGRLPPRRVQWEAKLVTPKRETLGEKAAKDWVLNPNVFEEPRSIVHKVDFGGDSSIVDRRSRVLKEIERSEGLKGKTEGGNGRIERTLVAVKADEKKSAPGGDSSLQWSIDWPLEWCQVADNIIVGSSPSSPEDLEKLAAKAKFDAIVSLQTDSQLAALGVSWDRMRLSASSHDCSVFRVPMSEHDENEQVSALGEAIRVVATLASTGNTVYIACTTGTKCSPLVALGFLSLFKAMSVDDATNLVLSKCPGATLSPSLLSEAKRRMCITDKSSAADLMDTELGRSMLKKQGIKASSQDEALLVAQSLKHRVKSDIMLSQAISKATVRQAAKAAERQLEEVRATSSDRITLLTAQISHLEEKQQASHAASKVADDRIQFFFRQVESLKEKEAAAKQDALAAMNRAAELAEQVSELEAREQQALESARNANSKMEELAAELQQMKQREAALKEAHAAAEEAARAANERAEILAAQVQKMEELEVAAKDAASGASQRIERLTGLVAELEQKEVAAKQQAEKANEKLKSMAEEETKSQERISELSSQVSRMEQEVKLARSAAQEATARIQFFFRQVKGLKEREQAAVQSAKEAREKVKALAAEVMSLKEADRVTRQAWMLSVRKVEMLSDELGEEQRRQEEERKRAEGATEAARKLQASASRASSLAKEHEAALERRLRGLQQELEQARGAVQHAESKLVALDLQMVEAAEKERDALEAAAGNEQQMAAVRAELREVSAKEAAARAEAESLKRQLAALQEQTHVAAESEAEVNLLRQQVDSLRKELSASSLRASAATERSNFLLRQIQSLKSQQTVASKHDSKRNEAELAELQQKLKTLAASEAAARAEAAQATAQVETLSVQVKAVEEKERMSSEGLQAAEQRVEFLYSQLAAMREKDSRNRRSIADARSHISQLTRQVNQLETNLVASRAEAGKAADMVAELTAATAQLQRELEEKVYQLKAMAGKGGLDPQLLQEEKRLLADVTCLREAVHALESLKARGEGEGQGAAGMSQASSTSPHFDADFLKPLADHFATAESANPRSLAMAALGVVMTPLLVGSGGTLGGVQTPTTLAPSTLALSPSNSAPAVGAASPAKSELQRTQALVSEVKILLGSLVDHQAKARREVEALVPLMAPSVGPNERLEKASLFCSQTPPHLDSASTSKFCQSLRL